MAQFCPKCAAYMNLKKGYAPFVCERCGKWIDPQGFWEKLIWFFKK